MKTIKLIILVILLLYIVTGSFAQSINWATLEREQKHIVNINTGFDYGLVYGAEYSYQVKSKIPTLLNLSYSFPSGENLFDDIKTKIGGKARLYRINNFQFSASVNGIYRRYETSLVRLQNFGSEMTGVIGYYKPTWFGAAEVCFDKAIVTHFKHSRLYRDTIYENVKDGWYGPAAGGNFNYGVQVGYSFKQSDVTLKLNKVITQDFKTSPLIPYYLQLGYNFKIGRLKG